MNATAGTARWAVRGRIAICACRATASQALGITTERKLDFDVLLDGRPLGIHEFTVEGDPESGATVRSDARFDLRILGISVYRYRHHASERWARGCLVSVEANTDDNGRERRVFGALQDGGFHVTEPHGLPSLPRCTATYAYWDRATLLRQNLLLNPQTGVADAVSVEPLGRATLITPSGVVTADRYRIHADRAMIDLWYSPAGEWLQLESTLESGRRILYRRRVTAG